MGDVGERVEVELVRGPVGRIEVDHHHEARVRASLHEILRLRVERGPVVVLEALPDERVFAVGIAERVDGVRGEEAAVRDAHRGKLPRALQLLVEASVRDPQLLLALLLESNQRGIGQALRLGENWTCRSRDRRDRRNRNQFSHVHFRSVLLFSLAKRLGGLRGKSSLAWLICIRCRDIIPYPKRLHISIHAKNISPFAKFMIETGCRHVV